LLRHFGIEPTTLRRSQRRIAKGEMPVAKGCKRDALQEAWERYP
jgi:hypothetical protein